MPCTGALCTAGFKDLIPNPGCGFGASTPQAGGKRNACASGTYVELHLGKAHSLSTEVEMVPPGLVPGGTPQAFIIFYLIPFRNQHETMNT